MRPDVAASAATFVVRVKNGGAAAFSGDVKVAIAPKYQGSARVEVPAGGSADAEVRVAMPDATLVVARSAASLHRRDHPRRR